MTSAEVAVEELALPNRAPERPRQRLRVLHFLIRHDPLACFLVALFLVGAIFGPFLEPHDPSNVDLLARLQGHTSTYLLGTDDYGRDLVSRILEATRVAAEAALIVILLGGIVGTILGMAAGGLGGAVDLIISRLTEIIQGFPIILLAISIVAITGPSLAHAMVAVGIGTIPDFVRVSRGIALQMRHREFVEAARTLGASEFRILWNEVLPNAVGPLIVIVSFDAAQATMYEATLSFLGLGVQAPQSSFGSMLSDAKNYLSLDPWYAIVVGIALAAVILGLNLLGDALSDYHNSWGRS